MYVVLAMEQGAGRAVSFNPRQMEKSDIQNARNSRIIAETMINSVKIIDNPTNFMQCLNM